MSNWLAITRSDVRPQVNMNIIADGKLTDTAKHSFDKLLFVEKTDPVREGERICQPMN